MRCSRDGMRAPFRTRGRWLVLLPLALSLVAGCGKDPTKPATPSTQTEFHVNAATGSDTNDGTIAKPFKTITHAIAVADTGQWIHVQPGTYDTTSGEHFPLVLKAGQTLIGDTLNKGDGPTTRIDVRGHGAIPGADPGWRDQYATIVAAPRASISGLRLGSSYEFAQFAIVAHDVAVTVSNNTFAGPTLGGLFLAGTGGSLVRENSFHSAGYGVYLLDCTDSVVVQDNEFIEPSISVFLSLPAGGTTVRRNLIVGDGLLGIMVAGGGPLIEGNSFDKPGGNSYGGIQCVSSAATPTVRSNHFNCAIGVWIDSGEPDLGTSVEAGSNDFASVSGAAVLHHGNAAISAIGNTWQHSPPSAGVDIIVTGAGSVRWGSGTGEIVP